MTEEINVKKRKIDLIPLLFGVMVLCSFVLVYISQNDAKFFCGKICEPFVYRYSSGSCTCDPSKYQKSFNESYFPNLTDYK